MLIPSLLLAVLAHLPSGRDDAPVAAATGLGDRYFPALGNAGYDVGRYDLEIDIDAALERVVARCRITAVATASLASFSLDFDGLEIDSLAVGGVAAKFERRDGELIVTPQEAIPAGAAFEVDVRYAGVPKPVPTEALDIVEGVGWLRSPKGVAVVSEPEGASSFYPVNDHPSDKATYRISVATSPPWIAAANGRLVGTVEHDGKVVRTFEASEPMASYLATIAVAEFDVEEATSAGGIPLSFYFAKGMSDSRRAPVRRTGEMIDWFATIFGPYPFDCGGGIVAPIPIPGALETQTRPVYGLYATSESIVAHEVAHQWFGDSVTMRDWSEIWLAEGFAEYGAWLWTEREEGSDELEDVVARHHRDAVRGRAGASGDPGRTELFGDESYVRGPLVLHALRRTVGDDAFFAILREWSRRHRHGNATIADFVALACEVSGRDVSVLLRAWLYAPKIPPLGAI